MKKLIVQISACLMISLVAFSAGGAFAESADGSTGGNMGWDGVYATNMRENGSQGQWTSPDKLLVAWDKYLQYNGTVIEGTKFFNNSSVIWTEDPLLGAGQIWFTSGDNRSFYWPDGAVSGRIFTGRYRAASGMAVDFRGQNDLLFPGGSNDGTGCIGGSCPGGANSCAPCSNGKVCVNGECICPGGTIDCFGQCLAEVPCSGGCKDGKVCIDNRCICPDSTKECNDRCINATECCGGCPYRKICEGGRCICPEGIDCPDSLGP